MTGSTGQAGTAAASTLDGRVERGEAGPGGWSPLVAAPGEPHLGDPVAPGSRVLASLHHVSDLHLCDAESPARLEYLDHHGDPGGPYWGRVMHVGTYRPQETLTVQVAVATLAALARLETSPATGAVPDAVLVTGDVTDNRQRNELDWYRTLLAGGTISPRSGGGTSSWVGAAGAGAWAPHFWHPDGAAADADGRVDALVAHAGFPVLPGLVEAARADVVSPGTSLPVLSVAGNHDGLLQGAVAPDDRLRALAVGERRVVDLPAGSTPLLTLDAIAERGPARYVHDATSPTVPVAADPGRALLTDAEHAAAWADPQTGRTWWARDVGELRLVALDTVNPHSGWQGSVGADQLAWLEAELAAHRDRYVVVTSHHPSWTLTNPYAPDPAERRHTSDDVLALLLRHPSVIAWVAGHVHAHTHIWHPAPGRDGGLVEITTGSLIDWPQQTRVLDVVREPGGTVAIVSTLVDHPAPVDVDPAWSWHGGPDEPGALDDPLRLAAVSRALAANDHRIRHDAFRLALMPGLPLDRNAIWRLPDPLA